MSFVLLTRNLQLNAYDYLIMQHDWQCQVQKKICINSLKHDSQYFQEIWCEFLFTVAETYQVLKTIIVANFTNVYQLLSICYE